MRITLLVDDKKSWIIPYVIELKNELSSLGHEVNYINDHSSIKNGDLAFFLGCTKVVNADILLKNKKNFVIHESELPKGKGFSPLSWQILEGKNEIPIQLLEAVDIVDSGSIYLEDKIILVGNELLSEIKHLQGILTKKMVLEFINRYPNIEGKKQSGESSYYRRRTPKDSALDLNKTLLEQFNLLRIVDNEKYPAFFEQDRYKYIIKIYKEKL
jgi:methionyl-tRNA formyltransferase